MTRAKGRDTAGPEEGVEDANRVTGWRRAARKLSRATPAPGLRQAEASVLVAFHVDVPVCFLCSVCFFRTHPTPTQMLPARAHPTRLHANLHLGNYSQGTRHQRKPVFQNCYLHCTSTPSWVPLAVRARLGAPVTVPGRTHSEGRPRTEFASRFLGERWASGFPGWKRSFFVAFSSRAWQPSPSGSSFLLQTGIPPSVMYPHFLSLFLRGAVFLPRKKVKREQRHMVFLLRRTPTFKQKRGKRSH